MVEDKVKALSDTLDNLVKSGVSSMEGCIKALSDALDDLIKRVIELEDRVDSLERKMR